MTYDFESQRTSAIQTLLAKRDQVRQAGAKAAADFSGMPFDEVCDSVRLLLESKFESRLARLSEINPAVPFAIQYFKIEGLIWRLNNGADPRTILYEIVSTNA